MSAVEKLVTQLTETIQKEVDAGGTLTIEETVRSVSMYAAVSLLEATREQTAELRRIGDLLDAAMSSGVDYGPNGTGEGKTIRLFRVSRD